MAISSADFTISISPNPIAVTVGMNGNVNLSFSNTSLTERGYNLKATLTLPDGVSYSSSLIPPTSSVAGPGGTLILTWVNIKDLAPNEIGYTLGVTLKADETFRVTGLPVPFDIPLTSVGLVGTVDTLPRGNDDPGNVEITKSTSANFIPLRYTLTKSAPGKMPKGAGLLSPITAALWPYQYTLTIENNSREPSTVTLVDDLPNGVRYLNALSVSGPDSVALSSPTVILPSGGLGGQNFATLNWGTVTLTAPSVNTIVFTGAIWDKYTALGIENSGAKIAHMAPLQNVSTLNGLSGPVQGIAVTNAMDTTINKSATPSPNTDVAVTNNYTLTYRINQYDNVGNVIITDTLSDGQVYNVLSASLPPVNPTPPRNPNGTTTLTWNLGLLSTGTTGSITFNTTTSANYYLDGPVVAADGLSNSVIIDGTNQTTLTPTPDSSSASLAIVVSSITKQLIGYFYKDGTPKTISVAAPGDKVEFKITYSSLGINAEQKAIEIDEYAPPNMGPLTPTLPVTYGGTFVTPFPPFTVAPNGLRWALGTVPGNKFWTADFKISVANVPFVGIANNLAKLSGINTEGLAYSSRDQVEVDFGQPNIAFAKTVTGPDVNAIKAGENYTYSVTISNPQNLENNVTDAFEMNFTDVIPTGLTYTGTSSVTGTGTHTTPIFAGQNVSMTVLKLAPGESLTLNYTVLVTPSVASGQSYINSAVLQRPYSQPDKSYQFPGAAFTASTTLKALGVTMTKLISPVSAKIGDTVTYQLQVTVPFGTTAYNLQVVDTFPIATQNFVIGSATKDGLGVTPSVVGGTVTFDKISVSAPIAAVTILYAFNIIVVNGTHVAPFIENQTDNATVYWNLADGGPAATPFSTSAILQVRTPNLTGRKEQRNVTASGSFTTSNVNYTVGNVIQYRITVTNTGAESAFDSVITDVIDSFLSFNAGSIVTTNGSASVIVATLTWNIPVLTAGASATLTFTVTTLVGVGSDGRIPDSASIISYNTNNNGQGIEYVGPTTNTVQLAAPAVTILKTASPTQGEIGDNITYTITITVPTGTIAYAPILVDTLPVGQSYIGPSTRNDGSGPLPVVPTVGGSGGRTITFPTNPNIDASAGTKTIIYTFVARIISATHSSPFQETQTDTANISWARTSGGTRVTRTATAPVIARTPNITILKEQKNVSTGGSYTTSNISGIPGNIIFYRFTITSNGASPAFNINFSDVLSSKITFVGTISGPTVGTVTPPPVGPGGTLTWNIPQLNNGSTSIYEFHVNINSGIGAGDSVPDSATSTYDSNDVNPITYNQNSNQVIIDIPLIGFLKTANASVAAIGSTINYTLTVTLPSGVAVNNLTFTDTIPAGQTYVTGSFGGTPTPLGVLNATSNQLIYTDNLASRLGPLTLIYTFNTTVISGVIVPPYTQVQQNVADVQWRITPGGTIVTLSDFENVTIKSPHITSLKQQRLVPAGSFSTAPLLGIATGNIVEYRITLTNDGAGDAYNVVTTDILDPALTYLSLTSVTAGVVTPPPFGPGGTINWTINPGPIIAGGFQILVFQVTVNAGYATGTQVIDQSSTLYNTFSTNATTLGPALSNQVAFNYNFPQIIKSVEKNALFVGDTANYTVAVTIPFGNIAYNVQLTDVFPAEQTYTLLSLKVNNVLTTPLSTSPLVTPKISTINATLAAVTVIYTFSATVNSIAAGPQQAQVDTATVAWTLDQEGQTPGTPQSSIATVYVTNSDITLVKTQSNNIAGPFVQTEISTSVGSMIYYTLSVRNPGPNTIFDVVVEDILNPLLQIIDFTHSVGSSSIVGNNLSWAISSIPVLTTYTGIVSALVLPGGGSESKIPNFFTAVFDAVNPPPEIEYGPKTSNTVLADLPALQFNKTASSSNVELGDIITYTLSVVVPNGTIAYNVVVSDTLPAGQNYLGNAFIGVTPVSPTQVGQTITFPTQTIIDATLGQVTLPITFDARVVTGNASSPYIQIQTDNANMNYAINPQGTPGTPLTSTLNITVSNPSLSVLKSHSNLTEGTGFRTVPISVNVGDIVRYKLEATSSGASPAYNVVITDVLEPTEGFLGILPVPAGTATYNSLTRTVTWVIDIVPPGTIYAIEFDIQVLPGVAAGGINTDFATYVYGSNTTTPIVYGPTDTNEVVQLYPVIQITKSSNINNTVIGNILTYTIAVTIPNGTKAYNVQVSDILPVGQQYNDNATLDGVPIIPDSVIGQSIIFPVIPFVYATNGAVNFIYTFESLIVSANVDPITLIDSQVNGSTVNWFISPETPAEPQSAMAQVNVTDSIIEITKLQRNVSTSGIFTSANIIANVGDVIEYSLTATNTGLINTAYNINITDLLPIELAFISQVSVPIGNLVHNGAALGGLVTWSFSPLVPGATVTSVFSVSVAAPILPTIDNFSSGDFALTPESTIPFKTIDSNVVTIDVLLITFEKIASPTVAAIGSIINYSLTVTIPSGVTAYNLTFTDVIHAGQNYVPGSFWGTPIPEGVLNATSNQLIYTDSEAFRVGPLTLIYTFNTTVITVTRTPPYTEDQRNIADLRWNISPGGPIGTASSFADVTVNSPHINALKEQRLVPSGSFSTAPLLNIATNNVVEYRITLTNIGDGGAYNVVTTDILDPALTYLSLTSKTTGVVTPPPPGPGGIVTWTINPGPITSGGSEILVFRVTVNAGYATGTQVIDQSSTLFDTLDTNPTTQGPELSNQVAFNYNNPEILKSVDKNAVFVGDIVNYTVDVTIPFGNIAYYVQLSDVFPPEQTYNDLIGLKVNNVLTVPLSTSPLVTPPIPVINATVVAKTVTYTFSATVNSIATTPQQEQVDTATVSWALNQAGTPGTPQSSNTTVYVTNSDITVFKTQSNDIAGPFVPTEIPTSVGNLIYYKLSVTNPGPNTIYDVDVTDNFNPLLQIIAVDHSVGSTIVIGNTLTWDISSIPITNPLTTYDAIVTALVLPGGGTSSTIPNLFTALFDAVNPPPEIEYGPKTSNTVIAHLPHLQFNKTGSSSIVELGEVITYTLSVIVPNGTIAYNVLVSDTLPLGQQVIGNAFIGPNPVSLTQVGQTITFPIQPIINASAGQVILPFTFDARVVTGNNLPPYTETQIDSATVTYDIDRQGTPGTTLTSTFNITVINPFLAVLKRQSNITQGIDFTINSIPVNPLDIVRYQLTANSSGASPAYNVVITDVLGPLEAFGEILPVPVGVATYNSLTRTVTWTIDIIPPHTFYTMEFDIQVLPGIGAGGINTNIATYNYDSNITTPIVIGPTDTNEVVQTYPVILITKSSNISNTVVGKILTYTVSLTIPTGTKSYKVQLSDILPIGQQYNDNATLDGLPVTADSVIDQLITFPEIPFVDATTGAVTYVYTFEAVIISATVNPVTLIDRQINESIVNWFVDQQTPALPKSATAIVNVTNSLIQITKLQRNVSLNGSFTALPIIGSVGNVIEYSLTVTNTGLNNVYNINITDILSNNLTFVSPISVPIGNLIHSGSALGGLVTWSFSPLAPGVSVTAVFSVNIAHKTSPTISNFSSGDFTLTPTDPTHFQTIDSNVVIIEFRGAVILLKGCITGILFTNCDIQPNRPCTCQCPND